MSTSTRRDFLKKSGQITVASTLIAGMTSRVHAAEDNTIRVALIGCGSRGTGAAVQALSTTSGPTKFFAAADVFPNRLDSSTKIIAKQKPDQFDLPEERKFIGLDAYKKAMDCLRPGDVVILATPPAFRWPHFTYAIEKGLNVFMEKPVAVDGPTSKKMLELGKKSVEKNLKVGVGLMCRHCDARAELFKQIKDGTIGEITMLRAYRMFEPIGLAFTDGAPEGMSELYFQIYKFHAFLWASGGCFSDYYIHNIDECCWMKDAWPVEAQAIGGRHYRGKSIDQNFDVYGVEYTFADGTKLWVNGRTMVGAHQQFASYAHGTKGSAIISKSGHAPAKCRTFRGNLMSRKYATWDYAKATGKQERNPYQNEWNALIAAIRNDTPFNEVERGVQASLVTAMGRMAAHTGQVITYDQIANCDHEFAPTVDKLTENSPAPLQVKADGKYPIPMPGLLKTEF